jgi:hypothetical protein
MRNQPRQRMRSVGVERSSLPVSKCGNDVRGGCGARAARLTPLAEHEAHVEAQDGVLRGISKNDVC